ncbi:MAG: hypothetical protein IK025_08105 [Bacteroidales bacterium]|nr:hypothetical protein [Bacteroidales bacterium]
MQKIETYYTKLRKEVAEKLKRTMESPSDFDYLSVQIKKEINEDLSASTLKRFIGYVSKNIAPSNTTLSILSRYLGYMGWTDFCKVSESDFITDYSIITSDLSSGDIVKFEWNPDRVYEAEYKGNGQFVITMAQNGTLKVGDTFSASSFTLNHPLYLSHIQRATKGESTASNYVAGYKSGLTHIELIKKN